MWGAQEVVGATVLGPGHGCCWAGSCLQILRWKSSSLLQVHPKGGMVWGSSTLWVLKLGAAPISWTVEWECSWGDGEDLHPMGHKLAQNG